MDVIDPLGHNELLLVVAQLTALLFVARVLGEGFAAIGQPSVVVELLAGVVLGPSLLGVIAPGVYEALFVVSPEQFHLLEVIAWLGLVMLLVVTVHVVAAPNAGDRFAGRPDLRREIEIGNRIVDRERRSGGDSVRRS